MRVKSHGKTSKPSRKSATKAVSRWRCKISLNFIKPQEFAPTDAEKEILRVMIRRMET